MFVICEWDANARGWFDCFDEVWSRCEYSDEETAKNILQAFQQARPDKQYKIIQEH